MEKGKENSIKKVKAEVLTIKKTRKTVMAKDMMTKTTVINLGQIKKMIEKKNIRNLTRKNSNLKKAQ